jgi:hypothetical protein
LFQRPSIFLKPQRGPGAPDPQASAAVAGAAGKRIANGGEAGLTLVPSVVITATMMAAISAASRPYSSAAAPSSSRRNLAIPFMELLPI